MLHPDELCICGHTLEVHFGHECTVVAGSKPWIREDCRCKEFAICGSAVDIFEALKALVAQYRKISSGLPADDPVSQLRERYWGELYRQAEAAIRNAKGE